MKRKSKRSGSGSAADAVPNLFSDGLRLDLWLWYARFYKTRALASKAVAGGHVRRNAERAKPADRVRPGDRLEIVREHERFTIEARGLPHRRGSAIEARACYLESARSAQQRQETKDLLKLDRMTMPRTNGRPDKHTRRLLRQRHRSGE
jgi:ribosome-associated heat shock protein Hsp15